jgi:hypothetical protein
MSKNAPPATAFMREFRLHRHSSGRHKNVESTKLFKKIFKKEMKKVRRHVVLLL